MDPVAFALRIPTQHGKILNLAFNRHGEKMHLLTEDEFSAENISSH